MTSSALKAGKKKMKVDKPKYVEKDWGSETWFANNLEHNYCGKILEIKNRLRIKAEPIFFCAIFRGFHKKIRNKI